MKKVTIYSDGSSIKASSGGYHGGAGAALFFNGKCKEISEPVPNGTNNVSELTACILALKALKEPCDVDMYCDSQYCIKAMTVWINGWRRRNWRTANKESPVKNKDLIIELDSLCKIHKVNWHWVKGHSGDEGNELADRLATEASKRLKEEMEG